MFKRILLLLALVTPVASFAQQSPSTSPFRKSVAHVKAAALARQPGTPTPGPITLPGVVNGPNASPHRTIIENLEDLGFKAFVQSAERAVLVQRLQGSSPHTVFVPGDAAFAQLPAGALDELWKPANRAQLYALLGAHIVPLNLREADLSHGRVLRTITGAKLQVSRSGGNVVLTDEAGRQATISTADLVASNGTLHVLDQVLAR
ncbi:fasciclin domain-containing protein [Hymenobacter gummosus]|nr:fasciclin domain-containing protein [Hymenobacter gummosus]